VRDILRLTARKASGTGLPDLRDYLFNFFTTRENGKDAFEPPFEVLKDLGDRKRLENDPK